MREAYKIILTPEENGSYTVFVPDFNSGTQGENLADAMYMARDLIGIMGITLQDMGKEIPVSGSAECSPEENEIVTYVDVDFAEYRRKNDNKKVKKTLTIPSWLNEQAEMAHINFSRTLEEALKSKLELESR